MNEQNKPEIFVNRVYSSNDRLFEQIDSECRSNHEVYEAHTVIIKFEKDSRNENWEKDPNPLMQANGMAVRSRQAFLFQSDTTPYTLYQK